MGAVPSLQRRRGGGRIAIVRGRWRQEESSDGFSGLWAEKEKARNEDGLVTGLQREMRYGSGVKQMSCSLLLSSYLFLSFFFFFSPPNFMKETTEMGGKRFKNF
jgi:hypothetical protein